jgi:hypothetical protein
MIIFHLGAYTVSGYIVYPISFAVLIMARNLGFSLRFSVIGLGLVYVLVQNLLDIVQYGIADITATLPILVINEALFILMSAFAVIPPALLIMLFRAIMKRLKRR